MWRRKALQRTVQNDRSQRTEALPLMTGWWRCQLSLVPPLSTIFVKQICCTHSLSLCTKYNRETVEEIWITIVQDYVNIHNCIKQVRSLVLYMQTIENAYMINDVQCDRGVFTNSDKKLQHWTYLNTSIDQAILILTKSVIWTLLSTYTNTLKYSYWHIVDYVSDTN